MAYDFPNAPTIGQAANGYVWDGEKWQTQTTSSIGAVRYDAFQGLTPSQQSIGRANVGVLKKNYIVNGSMWHSQENGLAAASTNPYYPVDQFFILWNNAGVPTSQQILSWTPGGSTARIRITATTADASVGASDYLIVRTFLEGTRVAELKSGTTTAKTVTLQFGVKGPAGTYSVSFRNSGGTRQYITEYVIAAGEANTDVVKSITLALDQTGTWLYDNNLGIEISWWLMGGSSYFAPLNAWGAYAGFTSANQSNLMATAGNVLELFDVSLTEGTVAPPFTPVDYATDYLACQRYYQKMPLYVQVVGSAYSSTFPQMRGTPVITGGGAGFSSSNASANAMTIWQTTPQYQPIVLNARM